MYHRVYIQLFALLLGFGLAVAPAAAQGPGAPPIDPPRSTASLEARQALDAVLLDYEVIDLPLRAIEHRIRESGRLDLRLRGRLYRMEVEPIDLRDSSYRSVLITSAGPVEVPRRPASTYGGRLVDDPEATVRISVTESLFVAYVRTRDEWLFVDPLRDYLPGASVRQAVVYREADVSPDAGGACGAQHLASKAHELGLPADLAGRSHTTLRRVDIATDADGEYFQLYGVPGTFDRINALINGIDGVYRSDVNLFFNVTFQQAWTNPATDPYTTTDIFTTLDQHTAWWNANRTGINRDVAHLFSGKSFSGNFIGLAWVAVVCNSPSLSYAVSEDFGSQFIRTELLAHEIGHNFAANHDDQIGCSGVSCNGFGPIMCSVIQSSGSLTFSTCSKSSINTHTHNNGSCLN